MPIATAWELGKIWYEDRLTPEWRPKTGDTMRTIFETLGLTGDFWMVP